MDRLRTIVYPNIDSDTTLPAYTKLRHSVTVDNTNEASFNILVEYDRIVYPTAKRDNPNTMAVIASTDNKLFPKSRVSSKGVVIIKGYVQFGTLPIPVG